MSSISTILAPQFHTSFFRAKCSRITASFNMTTPSDFFNNKNKQVSLLPVSRVDTVTFCGLGFDPFQPLPSDEESEPHDRFEFSNFVVRKALRDVECWAAAWLRAECQWENQTHILYPDGWKRKLVEQEYNAIENRTRERRANWESSTCIITVRKKLKNVTLPAIKTVVGTLDLNIRYLLQGETVPGERVNPPRFCPANRTPSSRFGYIANLCVAKSSRHKGIASNMLHFAVEYAKSKGVACVYVHVDRNNEPAQILYQSLGFEVVEMANPLLIKDHTYLLCLQM